MLSPCCLQVTQAEQGGMGYKTLLMTLADPSLLLVMALEAPMHVKTITTNQRIVIVKA